MCTCQYFLYIRTHKYRVSCGAFSVEFKKLILKNMFIHNNKKLLLLILST